MKPYRVSLHEEKGDKHQIVFWCWADDEDHAEEQALNAYPTGEVTHTAEGECPQGGDCANFCEGCAYSGDYEFVDGECLSRDTGVFAGVGRDLTADEQAAFDKIFPEADDNE